MVLKKFHIVLAVLRVEIHFVSAIMKCEMC